MVSIGCVRRQTHHLVIGFQLALILLLRRAAVDSIRVQRAGLEKVAALRVYAQLGLARGQRLITDQI